MQMSFSCTSLSVILLHHCQKCIFQIVRGISFKVSHLPQFLQIPFKEETAMIQDSDIIRHELYLRKQVGGHKDCAVVFLRQGTDQSPDLMDSPRVKTIGRFVQE